MPRYKLLAGLHVETGPDGYEHCYAAAEPGAGHQPTIFESNNPDLARKWPEKFEPTDSRPTVDPAKTRRGPVAVGQPPTPGTGATGQTIPAPARHADSAGELGQAAASQRVQEQRQGQQTIGDERFPSLKGQPAPKNRQEFEAALERCNVEELRTIADEEEIDIKGAKSKEQMIARIKEQV